MKQEVIYRSTLPSGIPHEIPKEMVRDPFLEVRTSSEPAVCSNCGAVHLNGRWQWITSPMDAYLTRCPACKRIHQKMPAGYVKIHGDFAQDHRNEMLSLIHHLEAREKSEHPLKRIMWIDYQQDGLIITTTDVFLARGIGEALHRAYKGELDCAFNDSEYLLHVRWHR